MKKYLVVIIALLLLFVVIKPVTDEGSYRYRNARFLGIAIMPHTWDETIPLSIDHPDIYFYENANKDYFTDVSTSATDQDVYSQFQRKDSRILMVPQDLEKDFGNELGVQWSEFTRPVAVYQFESGDYFVELINNYWHQASGYETTVLKQSLDTENTYEFAHHIFIDIIKPYRSLVAKEYDDNDVLIKSTDLLQEIEGYGIEGKYVEIHANQFNYELQTEENSIRTYYRDEIKNSNNPYEVYTYHDNNSVGPFAKPIHLKIYPS